MPLEATGARGPACQKEQRLLSSPQKTGGWGSGGGGGGGGGGGVGVVGGWGGGGGGWGWGLGGGGEEKLLGQNETTWSPRTIYPGKSGTREKKAGENAGSICPRP